MILFTLHRYRDLDLRLQKNKERLIDGMVKVISLYDDRLDFYLSYQDAPISVPTTEELDTMENSSPVSALVHQKRQIRTISYIEIGSDLFFIANIPIEQHEQGLPGLARLFLLQHLPLGKFLFAFL